MRLFISALNLTLNLPDVFVADLFVEFLQPLQGGKDRSRFPGQSGHTKGRQDTDSEGATGDQGMVAPRDVKDRPLFPYHKKGLCCVFSFEIKLAS